LPQRACVISSQPLLQHTVSFPFIDLAYDRTFCSFQSSFPLVLKQNFKSPFCPTARSPPANPSTLSNTPPSTPLYPPSSFCSPAFYFLGFSFFISGFVVLKCRNGESNSAPSSHSPLLRIKLARPTGVRGYIRLSLVA